ncbi:MAG: class I SAM-dependent methyltransferase [Syntrophaceae bacterium]
MKQQKVPERFQDENLASHWKVDETEESFSCLVEQLDSGSNFRPYFKEALATVLPRVRQASGSRSLTVLDLGSGVSWTSAIMANLDDVRHVYAVDPSRERLKHAEYVMMHSKVPKSKVTLMQGTFEGFHIPERADLAVLCASFHHCYDQSVDTLFSKIKAVLAPGGLVLIANEHYVDYLFTIHRFASFLKHFPRRRELFYSLENLRAPYPFDGEHWRTRKEVEAIFKRNGFQPSIFLHDGDLCKEKAPFYKKVGYHYYYAILEQVS